MKYDLIIVGAGISGCVCALSALKNNVENILIIEKSDIPGGSISPKIDFAEEIGIKQIFKELNLPVYNKTNRSIWISPSGIEFEFISKIKDIWIKRGPSNDSFDYKLIQKLKDSGIDILFSTIGLRISTNNIKTKSIDNGKINKFEGKIFVDASGLKSIISKNIAKPPYTDIFGFGFWGYNFDNLEKDVPYILFDQNFANGSYILLNVDSKNETGYLICGTNDRKNMNYKKEFVKFIKSHNFLKNVTKNVLIKGYISGHLYSIHSIPTTYQLNNMIIVGDAARFMDPFLHYGIQPSIISGYLAGKSISEYFYGESDLTKYTKLINDTIIKYLKKRIIYRKIFDKFKNNDIDKIFELINQFYYSGCNIDDFFENPLRYLPSLISISFKNSSTIFSLFKTIIK